jgi:hypothetical protein
LPPVIKWARVAAWVEVSQWWCRNLQQQSSSSLFYSLCDAIASVTRACRILQPRPPAVPAGVPQKNFLREAQKLFKKAWEGGVRRNSRYRLSVYSLWSFNSLVAAINFDPGQLLNPK